MVKIATMHPNNSVGNLEEILLQSWQHYQYYKIAPDGRPMADLDLQDLAEGSRGHFLTFSESVSYALFRAVIMKDQKTFRRVWKWTYENLWRINLKKVFYWHENKWKALPPSEKDYLFCWRYTPNIKNSGTGGIIYYEWQFETADDIWRDGHEVAPDRSGYGRNDLGRGGRPAAHQSGKHADRATGHQRII
jgi:endo-1,4-beta-D-glucanase Y